MITLKFKKQADAWKAYRFLALGVELGILPKLEFRYDGDGRTLQVSL